MVAERAMTLLEPSYLAAYEKGILQDRIEKAVARLAKCDICPRNCQIDRTMEEVGVCRIAAQAKVASFGPHYGEEKPLVGTAGSGTIFMTGCNLLCKFCQNHDISHGLHGREVSQKQLGDMMVSLQRRGCHNINFVSPSHVVPQILQALPYAIENGLEVPLVYNTGGYDEVKTLKLLDGIFDIYMPDVKFLNEDVAKKLCDATDYPKKVKKAVAEMFDQTGDFQIMNGIGKKGLLVRHLVMPNDFADTKEVMMFLASLSKNTYINIMGQYHPCYKTDIFPEINRRPARAEIKRAFEDAKNAGLARLA